MEPRKQRLVALAGDGTSDAHVREPELLTVEEAAAYLRVAPKWIYANAREIGGFRLLGDRGPWRFSRRELLARREVPEAGPARRPRGRYAGRSRPTHTPSGVPILPSQPRREAL